MTCGSDEHRDVRVDEHETLERRTPGTATADAPLSGADASEGYEHNDGRYQTLQELSEALLPLRPFCRPPTRSTGYSNAPEAYACTPRARSLFDQRSHQLSCADVAVPKFQSEFCSRANAALSRSR